MFSEENEERITVISITPQHITSPNPVHTNNSLRKSSLKQSSKYGDSGYNTDYASLHPVKPRETSDESNIEEYQIEGSYHYHRCKYEFWEWKS